jgi:hypothetical protein
MLSPQKSNKVYSFEYQKYMNSGREITAIELSHALTSNVPFKENFSVSSDELSKAVWNFQNIKDRSLLNKVFSTSKPLSEYVSNIFEGIASGKDQVFYVNKGFIEEMGIESDILFPLLRGKDIKPYLIKWSGYYVIYPYDDDSKPISEKNLSSKYPRVYSYLRKSKKLLQGRDYFDNSGKLWYELWNQRKKSNFKEPRIVTPEIASRNSFALTDTYFGNTKTYHIILLDKSDINQMFFLGLLNSGLLDYIYKLITTPHAGGFYAYKTQFLEKLPVPNSNKYYKEKIAKLVRSIIATRRADSELDTSALENQIDHLIYQLYGLTKKEIEIVEQS